MNRGDLTALLGRPAAPGGPPEASLPSGSPALDILTGGGWPAGSISEITGPDSACTALAYRTITAVQALHPGEPVILCAAAYDPGLARTHGTDPDRLLVTRDPAAAAAGSRLTVIDMPHAAGQLPARDSPGTTVLTLTRYRGYLRSAACIEAVPAPGGHGRWVTAAQAWNSHAFPPAGRMARLPACLSRDATAQEILHLAVVLGVMNLKGTWYTLGGDRIGNGWKNTARGIAGEYDLRVQLLSEIARIAPLHPGWRRAYA